MRHRFATVAAVMAAFSLALVGQTAPAPSTTNILNPVGDMGDRRMEFDY